MSLSSTRLARFIFSNSRMLLINNSKSTTSFNSNIHNININQLRHTQFFSTTLFNNTPRNHLLLSQQSKININNNNYCTNQDSNNNTTKETKEEVKDAKQATNTTSRTRKTMNFTQQDREDIRQELHEAMFKTAHHDEANNPFAKKNALIALAFLLVGGGLMVNHFTNEELKATGPYKHAVRLLMSDQNVIEALGSPIVEGYQVHSKRASNKIKLTFTVSGPKNSAEVVCAAEFVYRIGNLTHLFVTVNDEAKTRIDILRDDEEEEDENNDSSST